MILFDKPECPFCWKVRLTLTELGVDFELRNYLAPDQEDIWRPLTPNQTVPVLVTDDGVIYESDVILEYLEDMTAKLLPESIDERLKARLINRYSDTKIGSGLREVIFEKRDKPESEWDWQRINSGIDTFVSRLPFLEEKLDGQEYFTSQYSLPEAALTARFALAEAYGVEIPEQFPSLRDWFSRMKLRASFQQTAPW